MFAALADLISILANWLGVSMLVSGLILAKAVQLLRPL